MCTKRVSRGRKLLPLFALMVTMTGALTTGAPVYADEYTKVDVDTWDYDRTESLESQIRVDSDVEYDPPDDLDDGESGSLEVDYSNQTQEEEVVEKNETKAEVATATAVTPSAIEAEDKESMLPAIITVAIACVAVAVILLRSGRIKKVFYGRKRGSKR